MAGFLWGWVEFCIIRSASIAALATMFTESFHDVLKQSLYPDDKTAVVLTFWPRQLLTALVIVGLAAVNARGTRLGGGLQFVITIVKVASLLFIIVLPFAVYAVVATPEYPPKVDHFRPTWPSSWLGVNWSLFGAALVGVLWAYHGWMNIAPIAEEVKNPQRSPRSSPVSSSCSTAALTRPTTSSSPRRDEGVERTPPSAAFCFLAGQGAIIAHHVMTSVFGASAATCSSGPLSSSRWDATGSPNRLSELHPHYRYLLTVVLARGRVACA